MILTVVGARPQFVKAAVVSKALYDAGIPEEIVHTGQHYDERMSGIFWQELGLPKIKHNLQVGSGSHAVQTAEMIVKIESFLLQHPGRYRFIMVYGDTNSTLAAALVAAKLPMKLIHIESGLRSFNRSMPEEVNRIVTDQLSDILFCSSPHSVEQLSSEGIASNVFNCGDVMQDAVLTFLPVALENDRSTERFFSTKGQFSLLTLHRPSNVDDLGTLEKIFARLAELEERFIWPVHPRTNGRIAGLNIPVNITRVEPLSYFEMLAAIRYSNKVVTDSGGLQKEAYWLKKPCVTLRGETEWVETLHDNWNVLIRSYDVPVMFKELFMAKASDATWHPLYGDGTAAVKIATTLKSFFQ